MNAPGLPPPRSSSFGAGLVVGLAIGVVMTALIAGVGSFFWVKKAGADARRGWNLVPIVVAVEDLAENTVVTAEHLAQRAIPEQFVTSSVVRPDSVQYVLNQKLLVPVQKGDPLLWTQFETKKQQVVLLAKRDLAAGSVLDAADVVDAAVPEAMLTESYVLTRDRPQAVGRTLIAPFRRGDPILWTHFSTGSATR